MGSESAFVDLRRLADWFASLRGADQRTARSGHRVGIDRVVQRLGTRCIPLLGRELSSRETARREAARDALAELAKDLVARPRVLGELRRIAASPDTNDEAKVTALGLLAEHGERAPARFSDPSAIQRRSALALAASLDNEADVAAAADMMIQQMSAAEMTNLIEVMVDASRGAAYHLGVELCARLDLDPDVRERISDVALRGSAPLPVVRGAQRPTQVAVLVDGNNRAVVVASRKITPRRWRRWAVLIGTHGAIDDCVHDDRSGAGSSEADHATLLSRLIADGYHVASTELDRARGIVAAAARLTIDMPETGARLTSAYYLGRDLLDLGEAHLGGRVHAHPTSTTLGRAVELIADGDIPRAQVLLARCADSADLAAATAACLLAQKRLTDALPYLARAVELEPDFPLHHWNLGSVLHALGDAPACYSAMRRFLTVSELPTGLYADPDQPARVSAAARLCAELERSARLSGVQLGPKTRKRRTTKRVAADKR